MKNKLVFWNGEFLINITNWLQTNHPLFMQEWDDSMERSKEYLYSTGHNPYKHNWVVCLIDRMGEDEVAFNTNTPLIKWVPFQEYPKRSFADCMFETAQNIADAGKTIDFFWSGGLDSSAALLAFNELGLEKQLHVIMGGKLESPDLFEKIVKGRMNYTWDETSSKNVLFSIAQPDKHVLCSGCEADPQFGAKGTPATEGNSLENSFGCWENKRRYHSSHNTWGMAINYSGDWVDINNYMPFYMHESIEKWLCNHVIAGDMVYYHLEANDDWGNDWLKTGESSLTSSGQQHYKKCKMPLRNFIYDITKDKNLSYEIGKNLSTLRCSKDMSGKNPFNVLAITGEGNIINKNNFNDYDWSSYITNL